MSPARIIFVLLLVNAAGVALRYFELDTYFIFLGFRFHLSTILPAVLLLPGENLKILPALFTKPRFRKKFLPFIWIILSLALIMSALYLLEKIELGDPDYFYEFGLSSIFDFPVYLAWNFPQLALLFLTLVIISRSGKLSYLKVFVFLIFLFGYEMIPFGTVFGPLEAVPVIFVLLIASFFVTKLQNVYWFVIVIFSSVWSIILLFGSSKKILINLLLAREYSGWEGFFIINKSFSDYVVPSFFLVLIVIISVYSVFKKEKVT